MSLRLVMIGLSLSSSWGNGHATTYRALLRGLHARGHDVLFLEQDATWYAKHRDLPDPDFCQLALYDGVASLAERFSRAIAEADAVIVGSYVPDGASVIDLVLAEARGVRAFYDIDTPVTLAALDAGAASYIEPSQIADLDLYLSFTGGPILDVLAERYGALRPHAFYCSVDEILYQPQDHAKSWDLGYLGTYSADRQPMLNRLLIEPARRLPDRHFVVAGPQYPSDIDWPTNVQRIEHVPPAQHAEFYGRQAFTLNVTRADMVAAGWSPSVRLFEAAACGTAIISDRWPGLTALLPEGDAILIADDTTAAVDMIKTGEQDRMRIAQQARAIVLSQHTGTARAAELETLLASVASPASLRRSRAGLPA